MKKIILLILIALFSVTLSGCDILGDIFGYYPYKREEGALDFRNLSTEYRVSDRFLNIYYPEENDHIPYVNSLEFLRLISSAINYSYMTISGNDSDLSVKINVAGENQKTVKIGLDISFEASTISISSYDFFDYLSKTTSTGSQQGDGLSVSDSSSIEGMDTIIDLNDYNMSLYYEDDRYLMPFHLANLMFAGSMYEVYFNGDTIYGVDYYQLTDSDVIKKLRNSSYNDSEMSNDYKKYNYDFTCMTFDYFYGLKYEHLTAPITDPKDATFYDYFNETVFDVYGDTSDIYEGYRDFLFTLDDLHTSYITPGIFGPKTYNVPDETASQYGPRTSLFYKTVSELRNKVSGRDMFEYLDNNKTLVIFFTSFDLDTLKEIKNHLKTIPSTLENIVYDLSFNTGGNLGVTLQLLGFITDAQIPFSVINPINDAKTTAWYTTESKTIDANWYILTSPITFSAANLMASTVKEMEIGTIVGQNSSGGACAIKMIIIPDGSIMVISSTMKITDSEYNSIEYGIKTDYQMHDVSDRNELIRIINR